MRRMRRATPAAVGETIVLMQSRNAGQRDESNQFDS